MKTQWDKVYFEFVTVKETFKDGGKVVCSMPGRHLNQYILNALNRGNQIEILEVVELK